MTAIDKAFVKKSFNYSASTYDRHAGLQKRMVEQLLKFLDFDGSCVSRVLDIGMGTGNLFVRLLERFPTAQVHGCDIAVNMVLYAREKLFYPYPRQNQFFVTGDAEFLPYDENSFDLVASSFTYQWLEECNRALEEVKRVLKPGGFFVFSVFGEKTFFELRQSYRKACVDTAYKQGEALELFLTEEKVKQAITSCGLMEPFTRSYSIVETYKTVNDLLRSLKGMGARNASSQRNKTPGVRKVWKRMIEIYERDFGALDKIPATHEIIMGKGRKNSQ
jgi:malonyl-CoA O-methyltransferase